MSLHRALAFSTHRHPGCFPGPMSTLGQPGCMCRRVPMGDTIFAHWCRLCWLGFGAWAPCVYLSCWGGPGYPGAEVTPEGWLREVSLTAKGPGWRGFPLVLCACAHVTRAHVQSDGREHSCPAMCSSLSTQHTTRCAGACACAFLLVSTHAGSLVFPGLAWWGPPGERAWWGRA